MVPRLQAEATTWPVQDMKRTAHHLRRSISRMVIICAVAGGATGIWGCTGGQQELAFSSPVSPPPSPVSVPGAALTVVAPASGGETAEATPVPRQLQPYFALRGIWIQRQAIATREKANEMLALVRAGNFNAVFLLAFSGGYAWYDSALLEKSPELEPGYDPLAYVVGQAHRAGLQVHAWFPNGYVGRPYMEPGPILSRHPEWGMVGPDGGSQIHWFNFSRPDARQFMSDVMMEVVENYDVDGVHFDYIRYPGSNWSFDSYSVSALAAEHGVDLEVLRYAQLPAYGALRGNPLDGVETAEVLAEFDDGTPAVLLNTYGAGQVIVLNWHAQRQEIAAASEILQRSLNYLLDEGGSVYVLHSGTNIAEYGADSFRRDIAWLRSLGWEPHQVTEEDDLAALDANSVLVLPNVYVMEASTAAELCGFVQNGGGLIFIDGPVRAIKYTAIRTLTGMQGRGGYFKDERMILAVGESELIPAGGPAIDLQAREEIISQWNAFREESVNALVRDVYRRVKAVRPEVQVSAAVYRKRSWAADVFQDWYAWLDGGYVDFVVPMAHVGINRVAALESLIDEWEADGVHDRMAVGLAVADLDDRNEPLKSSEQVILELELLERRGINRVVIFDNKHISSEHLSALARGPFAPSSPSD